MRGRAFSPLTPNPSPPHSPGERGTRTSPRRPPCFELISLDKSGPDGISRPTLPRANRSRRPAGSRSVSWGGAGSLRSERVGRAIHAVARPHDRRRDRSRVPGRLVGGRRGVSPIRGLGRGPVRNGARRGFGKNRHTVRVRGRRSAGSPVPRRNAHPASGRLGRRPPTRAGTGDVGVGDFGAASARRWTVGTGGAGQGGFAGPAGHRRRRSGRVAFSSHIREEPDGDASRTWTSSRSGREYRETAERRVPEPAGRAVPAAGQVQRRAHLGRGCPTGSSSTT